MREKEKMKLEFVTVTPDMAEQWIKLSKGNPRWNNKMVNKAKVNRFVEDIQKGRWHPANNSIAFDADGVLVDGHHRLFAIAQAGIPCESVVIWGLPPESLQHIDEANSRSLTQRLHVTSDIVSAANIHFWMQGLGISDSQTSAKIEDWITKHPNVYEASKIAINGAAHALGRRGCIVHALLCAMDAGVPTDKLLRFCYVMNTGFSEGAHESAAVVTRNMLLKGKKKRRELLDMDVCAQLAIKDFLSGATRRKPYVSSKKYGYFFFMAAALGKPDYYIA